MRGDGDHNNEQKEMIMSLEAYPIKGREPSAWRGRLAIRMGAFAAMCRPLLDPVLAAARAYRRRIERKATAAMLRDLSDAVLKDIGLNRSEIGSAVHDLERHQNKDDRELSLSRRCGRRA
jgi:uncharacterized protein YjiS (DUF1127 family)